MSRLFTDLYTTGKASKWAKNAFRSVGRRCLVETVEDTVS